MPWEVDILMIVYQQKWLTVAGERNPHGNNYINNTIEVIAMTHALNN